METDLTPAERRAAVKDRARAQLLAANPDPKLATKRALFADAFADYAIAQSNIDEFGAVVTHPQTGTPMPNPYLAVRDAARKVLDARTKLQTSSLWD